MKQKDLAEKMGVAEQTVSRLAGGVRQIDMKTLARLCDALGVTIADLLVYEPDEEEKVS